MEIKPEIIPSNDIADQHEGEMIQSLMASSSQTLTSAESWLDRENKQNLIVTTVDAVLNWARSASLWPVTCFTACCTFEYIATSSSRFDIARFGMEICVPHPGRLT